MTPTPASNPRARWLRTLALADGALLRRLADPVIADYAFEPLRAAECGLVLLRARVGGDGERFNLGEATFARCVVRHRAAPDRVFAGVGYVLGRDLARAERIARLDALLQRDELHDTLSHGVLAALERSIADRHARERAAADTSRVRFFTLAPEATA